MKYKYYILIMFFLFIRLEFFAVEIQRTPKDVNGDGIIDGYIKQNKNLFLIWDYRGNSLGLVSDLNSALNTISLFNINTDSKILSIDTTKKGFGKDLQLTNTAEIDYPATLSSSINSIGNIVFLYLIEIEDFVHYPYICFIDTSGNFIRPCVSVPYTGIFSCFYKDNDLIIDSQDNIHLFWRGQGSLGYDVRYCQFDNEGNLLVGETIVYDAIGATQLQVLQLWADHDSDDNLYVVWNQIDTTHDYESELCFSKISPDGEILIDKIVMVQPLDTIPMIGQVRIATDHEDNINFLWDGVYRETPYSPYINTLYYSKFDNEGNSLIENKNILYYAFGGWMGGLVSNNDSTLTAIFNVYDTIPPSRLYYAKLNISGDIVSPLYLFQDQAIIRNWPSYNIDNQDNLHASWNYSPDNDLLIQYAQFSENGDILIPPITVNDEKKGAGGMLLGQNGQIYVIFGSRRPTIFDPSDTYFDYYIPADIHFYFNESCTEKDSLLILNLVLDNLTDNLMAVEDIALDISFSHELLELISIEQTQRTQNVFAFETEVDTGNIHLHILSDSTFLTCSRKPIAELTFKKIPILEFNNDNLESCGIINVNVDSAVLINPLGNLIPYSSDPFSISLWWQKGDVNNDGEFNVQDIVLTVNIILEFHEPSFCEFWAADVNDDDEVNIIDIVGMVNIILGNYSTSNIINR